ncbi:MAG: N-acetylmuramoyl-L-alanine amidase [Bacillota bacterium]
MDEVKLVYKGKALPFFGRLQENQTWVPIRPLLESLGHRLVWDGSNRIVYIDSQPVVAVKPLANRIICLDAGHGGPDPGAVGPSGLKEKDVTLDVVLKLKQLLQNDGAQVILTRDSDRIGEPDSRVAELSRRVKLANSQGAHIFVSVHCNSATNREARGTEIYFHHATARSLAQALETPLQKPGLPWRGIKQGNFLVIRKAQMPAVLVELAFISNPIEERLLADNAWRQRWAQALRDGIINYFQS